MFSLFKRFFFSKTYARMIFSITSDRVIIKWLLVDKMDRQSEDDNKVEEASEISALTITSLEYSLQMI